ncbi:MAG: ATP-dependent helicase/nuclease subunit [Acidimicrobiaceae bacterium]
MLLAPYGEGTTRALAAVLSQAKDGDPLRPVTVVVPSALAGITLRRRLATEGIAGGAGLVAVGFIAFPELAQRLASADLAVEGRRPLDRLHASALLATALASDAGPFTALARDPAVIDSLLATFHDLAPLRDAELAALGRGSERAASVVRLHHAFREATADLVDDHEVARIAAAAVRLGAPALDELGLVVLHVPRRLGRTELELVGALAAAGRVRAIVGRTERGAADEPADLLVAQLADVGLGPAAAMGFAEGTAPRHDTNGITVVRAPDPAEETRHAVRIVLDHLARGTAPERIAVISRARSPYTVLVHEELAAGGVAHSAPAPLQLAQNVAGRTMLALLRWSTGGHRRDELMRLLRDAPIFDPVADRAARPDRWDRRAREAGVVAGLDQWRTRLATSRAERLTDQHGDAEGREERRARTLAEIDSLAAFVDQLATDVDPGDRRGWAPLARWSRRLLDKYLSSAVLAESAEVHDVLDRLGELDGVGSPPDPERFLVALEHELARPAGRVGRLGHGVFVGALVDVVGADLDLVVVLGVSEGTFPPSPARDALLPDRERSTLGAALRPRGATRAEEERDAWAALASSPARVLTFPVADPRSQRARPPAPWLLALLGELRGEAVYGADVPRLRDDPRAAGWYVDLQSFEWYLAEGGDPASPTERDVADLVAATRRGVDVDDLAAVDAAGLRRGMAAARARADGVFGEWTGHVGARPSLANDLVHPRSPTSLQEWAACPFRYFLSRGLRVDSLDDPADIETISAADRGSLVHAVLERFVAERLGRHGGAGWDADDRDALLRIADEVESGYRNLGRTGRPLLWGAEWAALRRHLGRILDHDEDHAKNQQVAPSEVEHAFGDGVVDPVVVELGDGRTLRFGGRIDRIDRSADGKRLVVLDYKTGKSDGFRVLDKAKTDHDIVARGTLLQLPIYALAARDLHPDAEDVEAYYWFVGQRGVIEMKGGPIDAAADARFREVLSTIVGGIEAGLFPARPGGDIWYPSTGPTFANCSFCDYDRVCSSRRGEQWVELRDAPVLAPYVALAEGPAPGEEVER